MLSLINITSIELLKDANAELITGLSYKDPNTASFNTSRTSCSFQAVGGNVYSCARCVRIIRLNLPGEDWVDPPTLRIVFDDVNNEAVTTPPEVLYLVNGPRVQFSPGRLLIRSQLPVDTSNCTRAHELVTLLKRAGGANDDLRESCLNEYATRGTLARAVSVIGP